LSVTLRIRGIAREVAEKPTGRYILYVGNMGGSIESSWKSLCRAIASLDPKQERDEWQVYEEVKDEFGDEKEGRVVMRGYGTRR
jgi:hypothetical protein